MGQQWNQRGNWKIPWDKYNESRAIQNLWDAAKAILKGKFREIQTFLKKQVKSQINNLTYHLKELEKEEQTNLNSVEGRK